MPKIKDEAVDKEIHNGRRKNLRRSFLEYGLESFNETQVIEYALGLAIPRIDTNPTAHRLINAFGSLNGVIDAHPDKLRLISGIGEQAAIFLNFLKQFVTYYQNCVKKAKSKIKTPAEAVTYLRDVMKTYSTEQFVLICLDKSGGIILEDTTTSEELDKVELNLKKIVDIVLRVKTASVIVAHNHLNNNVTPSEADILLTRYLVNIFMPLSIEFMDHIIFGSDGTDYSFYRHNILDIFKREHLSFAVSKDYEDYWDIKHSD